MTQVPRDTPQFYLTAPTPCPYLEGQMERKVFTHLVGERAAELNDVLSQGGFRRSQNIAYRPACETCRACVSVRVIADEFKPRRSQRRILSRNSDIEGNIIAPVPDAEQYSLFRSYLDARHATGGMADMTVLDYAMMIEDTFVDTFIIEYRLQAADGPHDKGDIVGVALTDRLTDGLSMVYSFFEPSLRRRGLGSFMILDHIERCRVLGLRYLYLGYWVEGSKKMAYKANFGPQEHLAPSGWERYTPDTV